MADFIKGTAKELRAYMLNVVSMQDWIKPEGREGSIENMENMGAQVILATDARARLLGSFLYFPTINDPWMKEHEAQLPFDLSKAFTIALVWVHDSQRGKGLGKALFQEAHEDALAAGFNMRIGYGSATSAIWSFTAKISENAKYVEGLEYAENPIRYTAIS